MGAEDNSPTVYFSDGAVARNGYVYIAAKLHSVDLEDHDFSRMFIFRDEKWYHRDFGWNVVSVCSYKLEGAGITLCALSMQGDVSYVTGAGIETERIADAGTFVGKGAVRQIRFISGSLYVCGTNGQVYRRKAREWVHMDKGLRHPDWDLNSIDGASEQDIYVVGQDGRIFHWNSEGWTAVKSPTKNHLYRVRCVSPDEVYIAGHGGTLLRGTYRDGFKLLSSGGNNFWGLEIFEGKVYLAGRSLHSFDGENVVPLVTGLEPEIDGYRLDARDGVLWSFGVNDLAYFDGKTWSRIQHPDNPAR